MEEQQAASSPKKSQTGPIIAIVGLIVIVVVGIVVAQGLNKPQTENVPQTVEQTNQQMQQQAAPTAMETSPYKDGTYTVIGNYTSPGGPEELGVSLTIAKGVVTDSTVTVKGTRPMTKTRQTDFAQHYKPMVIGKDLDTLELGKVSGSSLSPKGFNDAVEKIKTEAKA